MKRAVAMLVVVVPVAAACVDLFHGTTFETLCDRDAAACVSDDAAAPDVPPDDGPLPALCVDAAEARTRARHACAWLGACLGPLGETSYGACVARMRATYDCTVSPGLQARGEAETIARCLVRATTCEAVRSCALGGAPAPTCAPVPSGTFRACAAEGNARAECGSSADATGVEPCALTGRTCARLDDSNARCLGRRGSACSAPGCEGTAVVACRDVDGRTLDVGRDCATVGDGRCTVVADGGGVCAPTPDAPACTGATTAPRCIGANVQHCVDGHLARVDCTKLGLGCDPAVALEAPADLLAYCTADTPECAAADDRCDPSGGLTSCAHARIWELDCAAEGLGPCRITQGGAAACTPPPP